MKLPFLCHFLRHNPSRKTASFDYDRQLVVSQCTWCGTEMTRRIRGDWDITKRLTD